MEIFRAQGIAKQLRRLEMLPEEMEMLDKALEQAEELTALKAEQARKAKRR